MTDAGIRILLGFTHALRAASVPVTSDRTHAYLEAVALLGLGERRATYVAGRTTLCATPADLERHDAVFAAWFGEGVATSLPAPGPARVGSRSDIASLTGESTTETELDDDPLRLAASGADILRHRDVADLSDAEREAVGEAIARLTVRPPQRRSARRTPARRGSVDAARTLRASLRHVGEPGEIAWRHRSQRPRRIVLLVDVSGSMTPYADTLLRLAHRLTHASPGAETFTVGTRLTRLTRALAERDPERALVAAGYTVPDWAGGTRLGENLATFLQHHHSLPRGAVVVVFSDGWERGDPALLGEQAAALRRLAHRVVWVNPHRGRAGYEPIQSGIVAVLDHIDDLVAGHSLDAYARLMEVISRA